MFAYAATAKRNYEGQRWVVYDRQYRREALARKDLNWSVTDSRLYNEAFTGRAKAIARCSFCLQDDHTDAYCPYNPNRPFLNMYPGQTMWAAPAGWISMPASTPGPSSRSLDICKRYNEGRCRVARCKYQHACSWCRAPHPLLDCQQRAGHASQGRSRSPFRPMVRGAPPQPAPR